MRDRDWLKENWKWFFPCLGSAVLILIVSSAAIGFVYVAGVVKTSAIYKISVKAAKENVLVQKKIGKPLKGSYFISGNISVSHLSGEADFTIPISGPQGQGTLRVIADKVDEKWVFSTLEVYLKDSSEVIDLMDKEKKIRLY